MATAILPNPEVQQPPTAEKLDDLADRYLAAKAASEKASADFAAVEKEAIDLVTRFGIVPPRAESSRRLEGRLSTLTVTTGNSTVIDELRVQELREALKANSREEFFHKLFQQQPPKFELVKGADVAIRAECMSKRLTEKILTLFGRCTTPKKKKPSLKVRKIAQAKPRRTKKERVAQ